MVSPKKLRNNLNTKKILFTTFTTMFFTDLDNTFTRSRAFGGLFHPAIQLMPDLSFYVILWGGGVTATSFKITQV